MKGIILYTALSLLNLIGYAIAVAFLPAVVPMHFDWKLTVDSVGSPWWLVALPSVAALISAGLWAEVASGKRGKNAKFVSITLVMIGCVFVYLGWMFFAFVSGGGALGDKVNFPFAVAIILPLSMALCAFGNYAPRIAPNRTFGFKTPATRKSERVWTKTHRAGGFAFFFTGVIGAVCAVVFSCVKGKGGSPLDYIALVVFIALLFIAVAFIFIYAHAAYVKENRV